MGNIFPSFFGPTRPGNLPVTRRSPVGHPSVTRRSPVVTRWSPVAPRETTGDGRETARETDGAQCFKTYNPLGEVRRKKSCFFWKIFGGLFLHRTSRFQISRSNSAYFGDRLPSVSRPSPVRLPSSPVGRWDPSRSHLAVPNGSCTVAPEFSISHISQKYEFFFYQEIQKIAYSKTVL